MFSLGGLRLFLLLLLLRFWKSKFQKGTNSRKTLGVVTAFICLRWERGSPFTAHRRAFPFASFGGIGNAA